MTFKSLTRLMMFGLLLSLGYVQTSNAATLEVGAGRAFTTIQSAVDAANGGDTILIHPGTYNESVIVANFDSNGDFDFDDPGDKDYSGLRIVGTDRDSVIIQPITTNFAVDGIRSNPLVTVYEPRGITDPNYSYRAAFLFLNQRQGSGSIADTYGGSADFLSEPYADWNSYVLTNGGAPVTDIEVANLTTTNSDVGIFAHGYFDNFTIRDCKMQNHYYGARWQGGVSNSEMFDNMFSNNLYGIILRDTTFDNDVVNNMIVQDDNFTTDNPWGGDGNSGGGILYYNTNNAQGEEESARNQISRNVIDYTGYTGSKPSSGIFMYGGRDLVIDNNFIQGTTSAGETGVAGWITANKGLSIEGWEMDDIYRGIYLGIHTPHEVSRTNFSNFSQFGTQPWNIVAGAPDYHEFPCDTNLGDQSATTSFKVPATGDTTVSFTTWFSENGRFSVTVKDVNSSDELVLFQNTLTYGAGGLANNYHFAKPGLATSAIQRHPYGASCSGSYASPLITNPNDRTLDYTNEDGIVRNGDTLEATYTLPPEWADRDVELVFDHEAYYIPAFTCEINGSQDWCGTYISNLVVSNSIAGNVVDETNGINAADWTGETTESSYALRFFNGDGNGLGAADSATIGAQNSGFFIHQNDFSNPWGNGIVFGSDVDPSDTTEVVDNNFFGNALAALYNDQANPILAENNWWNSNSGPVVETVAENLVFDANKPQEVIFDPAGVVDFTPFTQGLFTATVDGAAFGAGTTTTAGGSNYTIEFLDGERDILLGTLASDGTFTAGGASPGGPLLIKVSGADIAEFKEGDFLEITLGADTFRAYIPSNTDGQYGTQLLLWVGTGGSTFFYCDDTDRNCAFGAANAQDLTVARNSGDAAQVRGFLTFDFITTAGSDFNWYGQTHISSDVPDAVTLFDTLNDQYFADGGTNPDGLVRTLARWNAQSQSYVQFVRRPFVSGNFPLQLGGAYRVETTDGHEFRLVGAEPTIDSLEYDLFTTQSTHQNWVSVPWYKTDLVYASDFADDIDLETGFSGAVRSINAWNADSQNFVQYLNDAVFGSITDYDIDRGEALRLDLDPNVVGFNQTVTYPAIFKMPAGVN